MALALVCVPLLLAATAYAIPSNRWRPWILPVAGTAQLGQLWYLRNQESVEALSRWIVLDPLGKYFLVYLSVLFFLLACYAPGYLKQRSERNNRILCTCMLLSLSMMTLIIMSHHLGLMWVAVEATTLASAPSIYFNHNARSLEATWKYLLLNSVGIALALLGSFFLAYAAVHAQLESSLLLEDLKLEAPEIAAKSPEWLHAAFVFLIVGYGTKMGLAPMHSWKPDAYGEAPGVIGAMFAGGITNCAFFAILRCYQIANAAHDTGYVQKITVFLGLLSMVVAAISMPRQRDIKRLLAYSSVEHMGILMFGLGIGGTLATQGMLLHVVHNGLTKGVLFLSAGNIHRVFGSKFTDDLKGVIRKLPFSGAMFLAGFMAITGSPPFAPFVSEFQIVAGAFATAHYWGGALFIVCMLTVFIGMGNSVIPVTQGEPSVSNGNGNDFHEPWGTVIPLAVLMFLVVLLGVYRPPAMEDLLEGAVKFLGNTQ